MVRAAIPSFCLLFRLIGFFTFCVTVSQNIWRRPWRQPRAYRRRHPPRSPPPRVVYGSDPDRTAVRLGWRLSLVQQSAPPPRACLHGRPTDCRCGRFRLFQGGRLRCGRRNRPRRGLLPSPLAEAVWAGWRPFAALCKLHPSPRCRLAPDLKNRSGSGGAQADRGGLSLTRISTRGAAPCQCRPANP